MEKFPVGTIRGPYTCGIGHESARNLSYGADQGVQYAVRNLDGSWAYFIEHKTREAEAFKKAEDYRDKLLATLPPIAYIPEETIVRLLTK